MSTPEGKVAKHLKAKVKSLGGTTRKVRWEGRNSAPDLLVLIPGERPHLVETKRLGKDATPAQEREHQRLREWFVVMTLDSVEAIDKRYAVDV